MDSVDRDSAKNAAERAALDIDVFEGDFGDGMSCWKARIVTTRKEHPCHLGGLDNKPHGILIGARARFDKWKEEGEGWKSCYHCLACLASWDGEGESSDLSSISWDGEAEAWSWPFSDEQWARITTDAVLPAGTTAVFGVGPDSPDLILSIGMSRKDVEDWMKDDETTTWRVRFGTMSVRDFDRLPEHGGW